MENVIKPTGGTGRKYILVVQALGQKPKAYSAFLSSATHLLWRALSPCFCFPLVIRKWENVFVVGCCETQWMFQKMSVNTRIQRVIWVQQQLKERVPLTWLGTDLGPSAYVQLALQKGEIPGCCLNSLLPVHGYFPKFVYSFMGRNVHVDMRGRVISCSLWIQTKMRSSGLKLQWGKF